MLRCKLRLFVARITTISRNNFYVAESKSDIYFLQHENLLREKVVIRATNNPNLQRQHCCTTSCTKMLPVLLGLKQPLRKTVRFPVVHAQNSSYASSVTFRTRVHTSDKTCEIHKNVTCTALFERYFQLPINISKAKV